MWAPRRVSGALGWAASLDILLLFYPVPRSCFLNRLLGAGFPLLIKYHRWLGHGTMWLLSLHGCGYYALWCVLPGFEFGIYIYMGFRVCRVGT